MKNFKISILALILVVSGFFIYSQSVFAEGGPAPDPHSYLFHLFYDHGQLLADRDFQFKYDIILEEYKPEIINTASPYHGEVVSVDQKTLATFQFDPQGGNTAFTKGKISIKSPYFSDADKVNFYDNKNKLLLSLSVVGSSFCNDNGVCEADTGEDSNNCPNDCHAIPSPSSVVFSIAPSVTPTSTGASGNWLMILLIVVAVLVVAGLVVWFIMRNRRKKASEISINLPQ